MRRRTVNEAENRNDKTANNGEGIMQEVNRHQKTNTASKTNVEDKCFDVQEFIKM